jgi:hypothetical protein
MYPGFHAMHAVELDGTLAGGSGSPGTGINKIDPSGKFGGNTTGGSGICGGITIG